MKTYFISDLHLGHANCIRFDKRPWETAEEMDMEIIRRKGLRCEAYNVGAMWHNYEPQTFEEIIARQGRKISLI